MLRVSECSVIFLLISTACGSIVVDKELEERPIERIYVPSYANQLKQWGNNTNDPSELIFKRRIIEDPLPGYFDWREHNAVSPVKNQVSCDACWAFSVVANIESQLKIYKGQEMTLSEQFLIDCDRDQVGCYGLSGSFRFVLSKIVNNGGLLAGKDYRPYQADQQTCSYNGAPPPLVPVTDFRMVPNREEQMVEWLYKYGTLIAAINSKSMMKYKGHYIDWPHMDECPQDYGSLNHAVLIVGYNTYVDEMTGVQTPYWIIKNSWGTQWGDGGFYYLRRGINACGIANDVAIAFVTK